MSFAQERLYFEEQLKPGSCLYNIPGAFQVTGPCQPLLMTRVLEEVIRRHEALRTTFANIGGQYVQIVAQKRKLHLPVVDLRGCPEDLREKEVERLLIKDANTPFSLEHGPLMRNIILWLEDEKQIVLMTSHHIISDAWSLGILMKEFSALNSAFMAGKPSPLPELPVQYADYAIWQRRHFRGQNLKKLFSFWKKELEGAPPLLNLPTDRPRPVEREMKGDMHYFQLTPELSKKLSALSRKENMTLFMTLLAGYTALLAHYSGQDDVVVGVTNAARNHVEIENLIGFFINSTPLRARFTKQLTFRELLNQIRNTTIRAFVHQDLPFDKIVEELKPPRANYPLIFQVVFTFHNAPTISKKALNNYQISSSWEAFQELPHTNTAKYDMILFFVSDTLNEGLRGGFEYSTDLFDRETIEKISAHLMLFLERMVATPDRPISEISLLEEEEQDLSLETFSAVDMSQRDMDILMMELNKNS
ncbi:MAG: condensation domain-containing protein [Acidobacteriota bacterium]|nr:condensation domain-containing protein [Acidobacteriota bacterium]